MMTPKRKRQMDEMRSIKKTLTWCNRAVWIAIIAFGILELVAMMGAK
jgi:hypothetical protein